jgi:hypothetical protein
MEKENFPRRGRGIEMGSILDGGEWSGKVLPPRSVDIPRLVSGSYFVFLLVLITNSAESILRVLLIIIQVPFSI